jgi:tetratricopeptide (TPR) repeat protein
MLARAPELTVRSTSAAYAYKGDAKDTRRVGRELEVEYVLEGSVQKLDQKLRITARLVDTRTGDDVWGERLDRTGADPWALEDEVSGRIVGALTGELGQVKRAQYRAAWGADSTNMSEYDYYLRGHELYIRLTPEDNARAGDIWRAGLVAVPDSSLLAVKLGWHHFVRANLYLQGDGISDYAQASALVRRAVAKPNKAPLENRLSHWLFAYVSAQEGDYDRAIREMEVTLSLAPYDAFQLGDLSTVQIFAAQPDKALEMLAKALASDPANRPFYQQLRGWALHVAGRYEESIVALTEGIELPVVPLMQAVNHAELGRPDEAKRLVAQSLAKRPDLSQTKWRAANFHRDPRIVERQITRLAAAGLP